MKVLGSVVVNGLKCTDWGVKGKGRKVEQGNRVFLDCFKEVPFGQEA